jgi:hypothetical protein
LENDHLENRERDGKIREMCLKQVCEGGWVTNSGSCPITGFGKPTFRGRLIYIDVDIGHNK